MHRNGNGNFMALLVASEQRRLKEAVSTSFTKAKHKTMSKYFSNASWIEDEMYEHFK